MKRLDAVVLVGVFLAAAVCARLGIWQLSRMQEARAENARQASVLAGEASRVGPELIGATMLPGPLLEVSGQYDETHHVLIYAQLHEDRQGVRVVTPLLFGNGAGAVLVDRGWVAAEDGRTADPLLFPEPGPQVVRGVAEPLRAGPGVSSLRALRADSVVVWSSRWLDADSLAARLPYPIAPWVIRQLPGAGVPDVPERLPPPGRNPAVHLGYAIQWFAFALIMVAGGTAVFVSRRRRPT